MTRRYDSRDVLGRGAVLVADAWLAAVDRFVPDLPPARRSIASMALNLVFRAPAAHRRAISSIQAQWPLAAL